MGGPLLMGGQNMADLVFITVQLKLVVHIQDGTAGVAEYRIDPVRQQIADSWPDMLDDSCARAEWDWKPDYDLESMSIDMIDHLKKKLLK